MDTQYRLLLLGALAAPLLLVSCSDDDDDDTSSPPATVNSVLVDLGLNTLALAVEAADLDDDLSGPNDVTLFAPSDAAFAALPPGVLDDLLLPQNQQALIDILLYHAVAGEVTSQDALALTSATSLGGPDLLVDVLNDELFVNEGRVTDADNLVSNGVVHVIDRVLMPPESLLDTLTSRGLDTLSTAVTAANLDGTLSGAGPFTLLAPTDEAFAALGQPTLDFLLDPLNQAALAEILTYHAIDGDEVASSLLLTELVDTLQGQSVLVGLDGNSITVNGNTVSTLNIPCTNGVLYVLDAVLEVPEPIAAVATDAGFTTLVAALDAAGLTATFADAGAGPFTVFAPTDAAFAALPTGVLDQLLDPVNQAVLIQVLQYHVASGELTANGVVAAEPTGIVTLEGSTLPVVADENGVTVDGVNVSATNTLAANGIVHTIDAVLVPVGALAALQ